jgi:Fe-S-cluster containining protein
MPIEEFATRIEGYDPYIYEMKKTLGKGRCHFLRDNQCTIYELRPIICGFYPFELKTAENGKHEFHHTEECPGIGRGKALKKPYFKNLLKQL